MIEIINNIISLEASIFMPLIILCISLLLKMKVIDAIKSALMLSIAFTSISLIINFMFDNLAPVAINFTKNTNIALDIIDIGFSPMVTTAFAFPFAIFIFFLQIIINILMLQFNKTNILNIDIFNIWGKIFLASIITNITNNIFLGIIGAIIQIIFELKVAEKVENRVKEITNLENTTTAHISIIQTIIMLPINNFLDKIKIIKNSNLDIKYLKEKIGLFGEDSVIGFIVGFLLALFAKYSFIESLKIGIKVATSLTLLPICADFFVKAINPISKVAKEYMKKKYKNRNISIGLEWTILASSQELWLVSILIVPITLFFAIILAKLKLSNILPLSGLINPMVVVPALIVSNRNERIRKKFKNIIC